VSRWLEGKVTLLVGAGSGIGRAVADAFVQEGASVCVLDSSEAKCVELRAQGDHVAVVHGDATRAADNERAVAAAIERFGRLDTLATFVGIFDNYTPSPRSRQIDSRRRSRRRSTST
jgi:NAD(P)-dependent dehydrogenase (short-subunit alcohol dehydrogenase family)